MVSRLKETIQLSNYKIQSEFQAQLGSLHQPHKLYVRSSSIRPPPMSFAKQSHKKTNMKAKNVQLEGFMALFRGNLEVK